MCIRDRNYATEFLQYAAATPDTADVMAELGEIRRLLPDGEPLRIGTAAADRSRYRVRPWREHAAVIWLNRPAAFGGPCLLTLTDVGGAIKGRDRFDLCAGLRARCTCNAWGRRSVQYVALRGER